MWGVLHQVQLVNVLLVLRRAEVACCTSYAVCCTTCWLLSIGMAQHQTICSSLT
jgi:hypothetical protein